MNSAFLVGCPRSGTTLLQSMIARHSKVISFPETHFFSGTLPINPLLRRMKIYGKKDKSHITNFLNEHNYTRLTAEKLYSQKRYTHHAWCGKLVDILNKMGAYNSITGEPQAECWLEKTPRHLHYISSIEQTKQPHRFIHILREGKNVVASLHLTTKQYPQKWEGERSVEKCIDWWKKDITASLKYKNKSNHLLVVYEQLIDNPQVVLKKVCDFLSIEFSEKMVSSFHQKAGKLTTDEEQWKARNYSTGLRKSNKLQNHFSEEAIRYISHKTDIVDLSSFYL